MLQINIVEADGKEELTKAVNAFLETIEDDEAVKDIKVNEATWTAVIQYRVIKKWNKEKCYDCRFWDDGGDPSSVSGLCHECGQRRRFNCNACARFEDVRR